MCGEQEVGVASGSGWNLWVWLLGVVVRRYIDFLILLIPTPLVSVLFYSSIPTFCSFLSFSFFTIYITVTTNTSIFICLYIHMELQQTRKRNSKIICYFPLTAYNYDGEHTQVREGGSEGERK